MARKAKPVEPDVIEAQPAAQFKKPDLFEEVVARTNLKKRDVKPAVETALAVITEALIRGDEVNVPPMGKLRVVKAKEQDGGVQVLTLKLRTPRNASLAAQSGLAEGGNGD